MPQSFTPIYEKVEVYDIDQLSEIVYEELTCWVCGTAVPREDFDKDAGQCTACEKRNPMPLCMRPGFAWPLAG